MTGDLPQTPEFIWLSDGGVLPVRTAVNQHGLGKGYSSGTGFRIYGFGPKFGIGVLAAASAAEFTRIKIETAYLEKIAGKTFVSGKDHYVAKANGKMKGKFGGKNFVGAWNRQKGRWCRTIRIGGKNLGSDCQVVMASDNQMYFIRKQGKGDRSPVFTRK